MRFLILGLVMCGCVVGRPKAPSGDCPNSCVVSGPPLGMSNFRQVGTCRYEIRRGTGCCLVRFDVEASSDQESRPTVVVFDGGILISGIPPIVEGSFEPTTRSLCVGDEFQVCGERIKCSD